MPNVIHSWWQRSLSNPQIVILAVLLVIGVLLINFAGHFLAPIIASVIFAYLLDGAITSLEQRRVPRMASLTMVYVVFLALVAFLLITVVPILGDQIRQFLSDLPGILSQSRAMLLGWLEQYPYIDESIVRNVLETLRERMVDFGGDLLAIPLISVGGFITVLIYIILVPLLIFFFLKDKHTILNWFGGLMPKAENQKLTLTVWRDLNIGVSGYIRGKVIEILIMWVVHWVAFELLGLRYAPLLSFLVGLSVIIPFLGAAVVTIPIVFVAYAQWGFADPFWYVMMVYAVLQFLDGNVLVPLLFSEIVKLHPIAIICAVLVFGNIWGVWGVFFAIPLATLVNAIIKAWPREGPAEDSAQRG